MFIRDRAEALATAILDAAEHVIRRGEPRILHLAGQPPVSRLEWALEVIRSMPTQPRIEPVSREDWMRPSRTPARAVLATELSESIGNAPLGWREPLRRYLASLPEAGA
jgi:dTDP-4-dehydrorhamnose reductase